MAAADVKRAVAYIDSQKIAELESSDYSETTNGERQHGIDGVLGISNGNPEVELRFNVIRVVAPGGGLSKMESVITSQAPVTLAYKIGSNLIQGTFKCVQRTYTSDSRTGTLKGTFTFQNADNPSVA